MTAPNVQLLDAPPDIDAGPPMIHYAKSWNDFRVALCGARLRGITHPDSAVVDCHVCVEMYAAGRRTT